MENLINTITRKINKICFGEKFRKAFTEKFKICPSGLTYHVREFNNAIELIPMIKKYGYEHSCNDGVSEFTDVWDFDIGDGEITSEQSDFMYQYFKENEKEFFKNYMALCYVY